MSDEILYALTMPKWGMAMDEGTVTDWHMEEGAAVEAGAEAAHKATQILKGAARTAISSGGKVAAVATEKAVEGAAVVADVATLAVTPPLMLRCAEESLDRSLATSAVSPTSSGRSRACLARLRANSDWVTPVPLPTVPTVSRR